MHDAESRGMVDDGYLFAVAEASRGHTPDRIASLSKLAV